MKELEQQIIDYLDGKLTAEERQSFELRLSKNPELAEEIDDLKSLEKGLHAAGMEDLLAEMDRWESEMTSMQSKTQMWSRYYAVAAVLTLILVPAIWFFSSQKPTSEELFLAYYEPYEELLTSRSNTSDSITVLLNDGLNAYNQGKYRECSDMLKSYLNLNPQDHKVALYLAIAQLEIDQKEEAEANFVRAQQDPVFKQQAQWYQALSYLKFSESEKAKALLEAISSTGGHYRKVEAQKLLEDLS